MTLCNKENEGEKETPSPYGGMFKYLGIGFDIIIFAIVGWIIAKSLGWNEILGVGVGAIVGTIIMYLHLFWTVKRLTQRRAGEKNV